MFLNLFLLHFGFKRLFGTTPYQYFNALRMERAKAALLRGEPISSVASEMDFLAPRAFTRAFKTLFGVTPSEYRKGFRNLP